MIAVIFEVEPAEGRLDQYLDYAARLCPALEKMPGFISVERFRSLINPQKLLSLSFWESEEAVAGWRCHAMHRSSRAAGRDGIFARYRLRVTAMLRDYGLVEQREQAPEDSRAVFGLRHDRGDPSFRADLDKRLI